MGGSNLAVAYSKVKPVPPPPPRHPSPVNPIKLIADPGTCASGKKSLSGFSGYALSAVTRRSGTSFFAGVGGQVVTASVSSTATSIGPGWTTWSCGFLETVNVYASSVAVTFTLPAGTTAFGLEVEPDLFGTSTITFAVSDGSSHKATLRENAQGNAGAVLAGASVAGGLVLTSVTLSSSSVGFAVANLVISYTKK